MIPAIFYTETMSLLLTGLYTGMAMTAFWLIVGLVQYLRREPWKPTN
jgi:hypothetical protein